MEIRIPENVNFIINRLLEHGYEAYAVGGCVRDSILGKQPEDWDITTSARPEEVKELFRRTIDTGIQHGTVTIMLEKEGYEVTTYRIDGEYEDSRHPKSIEFTGNLSEDLKRRDFTINAMAYNAKTGLVDKFGGLHDLKEKYIRCVGNPDERFSEDALRILRAVRFSAQLGFTVDSETEKAMERKADTLINISAERIRVELTKLLVSEHPEKLINAYKFGITKIVLPEFDEMMKTEQNNPHHIYSVGIHTIKTIEFMNQLFNKQEISFYEEEERELFDGIFRDLCKVDQESIEGEGEMSLFSHKNHVAMNYTMLLHDVAKPLKKEIDAEGIDHFHGHPEKSAEMANEILRRLKFDNETTTKAVHLIRFHDLDFALTSKGMRKVMNKIGKEYLPMLFLVKAADIAGQNPKTHKKKLESLSEAYLLYCKVIQKNECVTLKELDMKGSDLIELGIKPGKHMGDILNSLLEVVLEKPDGNRKEYLTEYVKAHLLENEE